MAEKRKHARLKVELDVQYLVMGKENRSSVTAKSVNISLGGVRIVMPELLDKGTKLDLRIFLVGEEKKPIIVKGQVMWQKRISNRSYDTGIRIEELKEEEKERFTNFVFRQMYERIGLPKWPGFTNSR